MGTRAVLNDGFMARPAAICVTLTDAQLRGLHLRLCGDEIKSPIRLHVDSGPSVPRNGCGQIDDVKARAAFNEQ